jgi:gluconokinase
LELVGITVWSVVMILVLMGVSGSGKTTIGKLLAQRTGMVFADGDDYHSVASKLKMASGHPLNDEDRAPWLMSLNQLLKNWEQQGISGVLACSALEEKSRQVLEKGILRTQIEFIFLDIPREVIAERLRTRTHPFMNSQLLDSQLTTLQPPIDALHIFNDRPPEEIVEQIVLHLGSSK